MNKLILLLLVLANTLLSPLAIAADAPTMSLWERLRKKIEMLTPQKKMTVTNAVGGVRGAASDANDLYWKGEMTQKTIDEDELIAFQKAMNLVEAGNKTEAHLAFEAFIKMHPESVLRKDAEQALAELP
jgi:TolA-binding protein